eukprot:1616280-Rhodomonas_salina.1
MIECDEGRHQDRARQTCVGAPRACPTPARRRPHPGLRPASAPPSLLLQLPAPPPARAMRVMSESVNTSCPSQSAPTPTLMSAPCIANNTCSLQPTTSKRLQPGRQTAEPTLSGSNLIGVSPSLHPLAQSQPRHAQSLLLLPRSASALSHSLAFQLTRPPAEPLAIPLDLTHVFPTCPQHRPGTRGVMHDSALDHYHHDSHWKS